jgi:hypothetical protein
VISTGPIIMPESQPGNHQSRAALALSDSRAIEREHRLRERGELSAEEKTLVRDAVRDAMKHAHDPDDGEGAAAMLRIRYRLKQQLTRLLDPSRAARRVISQGAIVSSITASIVVIATIVYGFIRVDTPDAQILTPVMLLGGFALLFTLSWIPFLIGLLQAGRIRRRARLFPKRTPDKALLTFDVTLVKQLLKEE